MNYPAITIEGGNSFILFTGQVCPSRSNRKDFEVNWSQSLSFLIFHGLPFIILLTEFAGLMYTKLTL